MRLAENKTQSWRPRKNERTSWPYTTLLDARDPLLLKGAFTHTYPEIILIAGKPKEVQKKLLGETQSGNAGLHVEGNGFPDIFTVTILNLKGRILKSLDGIIYVSLRRRSPPSFGIPESSGLICGWVVCTLGFGSRGLQRLRA